MSRDKIERFEALVAREPDNPLHSFALAQICWGSGEFERAEQVYARCLELDPRWMMAAIRRGACLVALARWDEARAALELGQKLAVEQDHSEPFDEIRELMDQLPSS